MIVTAGFSVAILHVGLWCECIIMGSCNDVLLFLLYNKIMPYTKKPNTEQNLNLNDHLTVPSLHVCSEDFEET